MRILTLTDWYEPGYRAGGPIRSCVNLVRALTPDCSFSVLSSDRDLGTNTPYPDLSADCWLDQTPHLRLYYASPAALNARNLLRQIRSENPDCLYLNSMYSPKFTLLPLLLRRLGLLRVPVVLAPRGMLQPGAMQFKAGKKQLFLKLASKVGLYKGVHFQATDEQELLHIRRWFPNNPVKLVANVPELPEQEPGLVKKQAGTLRVIFVGRVSPVKNLAFLIEQLRTVDAAVQLDIAGPVEDTGYWAHCQTLLAGISWKYLGELPHFAIRSALEQNHIFALTTFGENFGHAIWEALIAGRPVLISDTTPWQHLEAQQAGWVCSLDEPEAIQRALAAAAAMDNAQFQTWSRAAFAFAKRYVEGQNWKTEYLTLFRDCHASKNRSKRPL